MMKTALRNRTPITRRLFQQKAFSSQKLVDWKVDDDKIGTLTLQSPETLNALTVEMGQEFQETCRQILKDLTINRQEVGAIVLRGAGDKAFSAGGNLDWLRGLGDNSLMYNAELMMQFYRSFLCVRTLPVPVIAAIQGPAIGAGAGLALACDLRTAAPKPRILGFNFSTLGIHSGMGGSHLLEKAVNSSAILNEILLTGKVLSGQECLELGLVNRLDPDPVEAAYDLARTIGKQHPVAIRTMLQTARQRQDDGLDEALMREAMCQAVCYNRQDWGEGVNAVPERREPKFDDYHVK